MIKDSRAYLYAKWCVQKGNRKVGKYVKLQAKKWLKIADGKHKDAYVSEKAYRKICKLLKLMVHPDLQCSMYDGLEDYAWFLIVAVFCTLRRSDNRRFYQTALLEIARKNFKTFNSAVIFILGMLTEPRFSRFFSVAPDYAYIHKEKGEFKSLHYVDEEQVSITKNQDPIFKDYKIMVGGVSYEAFDFLKVLRNSKDGATGVSIVEENSMLIDIAYSSMLLERNMGKRGGSKRGFLKSEKKIDQAQLDSLRTAFRRLYSGDSSDNFVVLNNNVDFKEATDTAAEMQLHENKTVNATEFAKIFHISPEVMAGKASENDVASLARLAAIPLMVTIQCALNRDLLLEKEKGTYYWAFDTKELLKGDMKHRFDAYKTALDANFMQIDEVRYAEDLEPLGLCWIKLGLQDVLYDPKTKQIYTPNTNQTTVMNSRALPGDPAPKGGGNE